MRHLLTLAVCVSMQLPAGQADARERRVLHPSSKWFVDYDDQSCRLARSFGQGDDQVHLMLDQFAPGGAFRVLFAGQSLAERNFRIGTKAKIRFGPNENASDIDGFIGKIGELPAFIAIGLHELAPLTAEELKALRALDYSASRTFFASRMSPERERAVTWLELTNLLKFDFAFSTGPMDKPLQALRDCSWDTIRSWGLDVQTQKTLSRPPRTKQQPTAWFSADDYPKEMITQNQQAVVYFRIIINEKGQPTNCVIQRSTRPKDFDDVVCKIILKRARFDPALDAAGKPVASYFSQSVVFKIN